MFLRQNPFAQRHTPNTRYPTWSAQSHALLSHTLKAYAQNTRPKHTSKTHAQNTRPNHTPKAYAQSLCLKHTPKTHASSIRPKHMPKIPAQSSWFKDALCECLIIIYVQICEVIATHIPLEKLSSAVFRIDFYLRIRIRIHNSTMNMTHDNSATCTSTTHHFHWMHSCADINSCS